MHQICKHDDVIPLILGRLEESKTNIDSGFADLRDRVNAKVSWIALGIMLSTFGAIIGYQIHRYDKNIDKLVTSMDRIVISVTKVATKLDASDSKGKGLKQ